MLPFWFPIVLGLRLGLSSAEELVLPPPPGPYAVTMLAEELVDRGRLDPYNTSHPRRMMISRFAPIPRERCSSNCHVEYMPPLVAELEDAIGEAFLGNLTWPPGILSKVKLELCCDPSPAPGHGYHSFPTVLLDTGINTTRLFYAATAQSLASRGYNVITMDHPYETDVVAFPDGSIIYGGRVNRTSSEEDIIHALEVRANDATFVLDVVDKKLRGGGSSAGPKFGYVGHSFGGPAAAMAMLNDTRIVAGVNLDGRLFGPVLQAGLGRPGINQSFLIFGATGHNSSSEESWERLWQTTQLHPGEWMKELSVMGSLHGTFWDLALIGDVSGLRSNRTLVENLLGDVTGARIMEILRDYLDDYFKMTLRGASQGLLGGPSRDYPEVEFLRSSLL